MTVRVNGSNQEVPEAATLQAVLERLRLKQDSVAVELNERVVDRSAYPNVRLRQNDVLEIVHFVGGG